MLNYINLRTERRLYLCNLITKKKQLAFHCIF